MSAFDPNRLPDHELSTATPDPNSKRGHPHPVNKLAKVLRDQGKPYPEVVDGGITGGE